MHVDPRTSQGDGSVEDLIQPETVSYSRLKRNDVELLIVDRPAPAPTEAPSILLVHGAAHTHHTFDRIVRHLQTSMNIRLFDWRGHGESDWSPPGAAYTHDVFVEDMREVIRDSGKERMTVVASSLAGLHALKLAAEQPEAVEKLVLVDILPFITPNVIRSLEKFFFRYTFESFDQLVEGFVWISHGKSKEAICEECKFATAQDPATGAWKFKHDRRIADIISPDQLKSFEKYASAVQCPVVLLRGENAGVVPDSGIRDFVELLPEPSRFRHIDIRGGEHCPWRENPEDFCETLLEIVT